MEDKKSKKKVFSKKCKNCEDYKASWARAQADYQNLQKEVEQRQGEWARMSEQQILEEFIPIYDNFKKAFNHCLKDLTPEQDNWVKGIQHIMTQFELVLQNHGVKEIKTLGEEFNPELHEAVGEEESDEYEAGVVVKKVDSGYMMKDRVIKCAKVIICK